MSSCLYQVWIKAPSKLSEDLRADINSVTAKKLTLIACNCGMLIVCTFDGLIDYCQESEKEGIENYPLYYGAKNVISDPKNRNTSKIICVLPRGRASNFKKDSWTAL